MNLLPLLDDTDFKTREVAIAYDAAGMDLVWNFITSAGVITQTAVTPTTAGDYDWTHVGDGIYKIEIPASGGASINNDTEGFGWFTGVATGVLPWRGPVIGFRAAALNNALIDGGDNLDVSVTQWNGTNVATPDTAGVPKVTIKSGTGAGEVSITSGVVSANMTQVSGDSTAADNWEAALDGTGGVTITAALTGNITGNLSGSVGSVTGAVGSVTGAVGSVTGNVGGNVVGTVASVVTKTGYSLASTGLDLVVPSDPSAKPVLGTDSIVSLIGWFGAWSLNETNSTSTAQTLRNSADTADLVTHTLSDNGTTFSSGTGA